MMMEEDTSGVVLPRSAMCEEMQAEESAGPVIGAVQPEPILIDEKPAPLFSKALQKKTKKEKEVEVAQLIDKSKKNALRLRELIVNLKLNSTPNDEACNDLYHMTQKDFSKAARLINKLAVDLFRVLPRCLDSGENKGCRMEGCEEVACWTWPKAPSHVPPEFCHQHKLLGMVEAGFVCAFAGCKKEGIYRFLSHPKCDQCSNLPAQTAIKFCSAHKKNGMENVKRAKQPRPTCDTPNCSNVASYSDPSTGEAKKFCRYCRPGGKSKTRITIYCDEPDCPERASFNYEKDAKGVKCQTHKLEGMVLVKRYTCKFEGCIKTPAFNFPDERKGIYCSTHKVPTMINVLHKASYCQYEQGCDLLASFNNPGSRHPKYCSKHKLEGMCNIKGLRCEEPTCPKIPSFNMPGERRGRFCVEHKLEGMVDLKKKTCEFPECGKAYPCFNFLGTRHGRFCATHRQHGMVNVKTKHCAEPGCHRQPHFNFRGEGARGKYCATHRLEGMVDLVHKKCQFEGCHQHPSYNYEGMKTRIYCSQHKLAGMVNLR